MTFRPWFLLESGPGDAAFNMALDHALLAAMPRLGSPVLRFYSWTQKAASFGYAQKYAEIEQMTSLRPLVRRPTGGGLVPHEADWTYSVVFPATDDWYSLPAIDSYRRVHEWIQSAFARLNLSTEIAPCCRKAAAGQCFAGHEKFDLLWHDRKIAGAAQRRIRDGLLIQGSVQPPIITMAGADWRTAMCAVGESEFGARWAVLRAEDSLWLRVDELARQKYSQDGHNRKR